jgi:small subunit ribosomal protein S4
MARYIGPNCKLCRKEGLKLFLKGTKCNTQQCPFSKRPYAPGEHGKMNKKPSYYALQLREKQKTKSMYGILERQFRRYFHLASSSKGVTGRVLLQFLERRLDNVVYRMLFSSSRSQARQIVKHDFVRVNNKKVNIPSYLVNKEDKIEIKDKGGIGKEIKLSIETLSKERSVASWLFLDKEKLKGEVLRLPEKEDLSIAVNERLIVELYSK